MKKTLEIGTVINDKWIIVEFIAKGGMGEVYRAHQPKLKRDVAIKVISREWLESFEDDEEEIENGLQRFRNEVKTMAQVRHPNVLQIFDYGTLRTEAKEEKKRLSLEYIVMEYVSGGTLKTTMQEDGFYPEENATKEWIKTYFIPVLDGVEALHDVRVIHRDLKPGNILLDGNIPKIGDFGLARSCKLQAVSKSVDLLGTPAYMPPEQFLDFRRADERADIYALGKILYEAVAGKMKPDTLPFRSVHLEETQSPFFKKVDALIRKATAEDREARPETIKDFKRALIAILKPEDKVARESDKKKVQRSKEVEKDRALTLKWVAVAVVGVAILAAALLHIRSMQKTREKIPVPSHSMATKAQTKRSESPEGKKSESQTVAGSSKLPSRTVVAEDGVKLHLVPGGTFKMPGNFGPESNLVATIKPFYMDETQVTNHQFVDFLNQLLPEIKVEKGVVSHRGRIWFLLGEIMEGYEPIVYRGGKFHIYNPAHASCPVVRVTPYGASAYAKFYGRRLPTTAEWVYALKQGKENWSVLETHGINPLPAPVISCTWVNCDAKDMMHMMDRWHRSTPPQPQTPAKQPEREQLQKSLKDYEPPSFPSPVILYRQNRFGIRGLNENVAEWCIRMTLSGQIGNRKKEYVILGKKDQGQNKNRISAPLPREPWESFEEVSFRCVKEIPTK